VKAAAAKRKARSRAVFIRFGSASQLPPNSRHFAPSPKSKRPARSSRAFSIPSEEA
jgi:hypothetical protein